MSSLSRNGGGLFDSGLRLHQALSDAGVRVTMLGLQDASTEIDLQSWASLPAQPFPVFGPRSFGYSPALRRYLLNSDFDLLHVHGLWMYPSAAALAWHECHSRPYLVSPHGMLDQWAVRNSRIKKRIAAILYEDKHLQKAACIRALCESEAQAIRAYGLKNPIAVIPNGIDLPELNDEKQKAESRNPVRLLKDSGCRVLLYLGRIHPKKGLVNLIKAWAALRNSQPSTLNSQLDQWVLAIAGWDQNDHEAELKRLASQLDLRWADVRTSNSQPSTLSFQLLFVGPQFGPDKSDCYRNCDAFILPSFSEGLPMVVLEAWAYAKPVLMTAECNLREGLAAGAAIRIETKADSIAHGLEKLIRFPSSDLRALGCRGRALVAERFGWRKIAAEMKQVYEWVLGGGPRPACVAEEQ